MTNLLKAHQKCEIMSIGATRQPGSRGARIMEGPSVNRLNPPAALGSAVDEFAWNASEEILSPLPNDLTRLIYLTSIRDYNSGTYRHPQLSRQFSPATAHRAFALWHEEVFTRLLMTSLANYVEQLEGYLRYSRAERSQFIETWKSLQAYKAAVPLHVPPRARETFFLNIEAALAILENPLPESRDFSSSH